MGFLTLEGGMSLRGACRHIRFREDENGEQSDSLDVFRYCRLYSWNDPCTDVSNYLRHVEREEKILSPSCHDVHALEQILANKTFRPEREIRLSYVHGMKYALLKANNTVAFSVLANSGYMTADIWVLRQAWKRGHAKIASIVHALLLQENEQNPGTFPMCSTCQVNV